MGRRASGRLTTAWRGLLLLSVLIGLVACGGGSSGPTDPTAGVTVLSQDLVTVSSQICHVKGAVTNTSLHASLDITLTWQGLDASGNVLGETGVVITNVAPGATASFEATAIASSNALIPCSKIASLNRTQTAFSPS